MKRAMKSVVLPLLWMALSALSATDATARNPDAMPGQPPSTDCRWFACVSQVETDNGKRAYDKEVGYDVAACANEFDGIPERASE